VKTIEDVHKLPFLKAITATNSKRDYDSSMTQMAMFLFHGKYKPSEERAREFSWANFA